MTATASRSRATQRVRRNRITERDSIAVAVIAVAAAVGGAVAGAHPTAWRPADVVLTACFAGFVAWAGASSPWWALAGCRRLRHGRRLVAAVGDRRRRRVRDRGA